MRKITRLLLLLGLWVVCGCTTERASIIGSEWVSNSPQVEFKLRFEESVCVATKNSTIGGIPTTKELIKAYTYAPPKVIFLMPDGGDAAGVFYDDYQRLEVMSQSVNYSFTRTK